MLFKKLRAQVKVIAIVITVTFLGGMLYAGGTSLFGGGGQQQAEAAIATVNGHPITAHEFQQAFFNQLEQLQNQQQRRIDGSMLESVKYQTLESLVGHILLTQEIDNRSIEVADSEIDEMLDEIRENFPSEEDFENQLSMTGLTVDRLKEYLKQDLQIEKLRDEVAGDIDVAEEDIIAQYEQVKASHILIRPEGEDEEALAQAKAKAEEILAKTATEDFAELAKEFSEDPGSGSRGGDLGFFGRGEMIQPFEEAAFSLGVGEISGVIETDFGYHILKVTDQKLATDEEFAEAREEIAEQLRAEQAQKKLVEWFEGLREEAEVQIADNQLIAHEKALEEQYEDALHYYNLAVEDNPEDGYLYVSQAKVLQELDREEEALAAYEKATEIVTNDGNLFLQLAKAYQENEKEDEAVATYLEASELAPMDLFLQLQVFSSLNQLERYEDAKVVEDRISEIQRIQQERAEAQQQEESQLEATPLEETEEVEEVEEVEGDGELESETN